MKKTIVLAASILFSLSTIAGNGDNHGDKYCAKLKDGKLTVMHEGMAITSDVTLADGSTVKMDGTVTKKDGSTMMLKEGECISKEGKMMTMSHDKTKSGSK